MCCNSLKELFCVRVRVRMCLLECGFVFPLNSRKFSYKTCKPLSSPYFDLPCYAASTSGDKVEAMEELNDTSNEGSGFLATHLSQLKRWLLTHSQHLNFLTILILASVSLVLFPLHHYTAIR